jgi:hypothetical protein
MTDIEQHAKLAAINRLWTHTVAVLNRIPTVGNDPLTGRKGDSEEPGTGCAVRWGAHHCILTAKHVIENAGLRDIDFFYRQSGRIEEQRTLRPGDICEAVPLNDPNATIHVCAWEDLALVVTVPDAIPHLEFFEIGEERWSDPQPRETIHCLGYPSDLGVIVGARTEGNREVRDIALYSSVFSADVLDEQSFAFRDFDPAHHYLVPFEGAANGRSPKGFSGSGVWLEHDEKQIIWTPKFKFAGICVASYKSGSVLQIVKASIVRTFLQEVFGTLA